MTTPSGRSDDVSVIAGKLGRVQRRAIAKLTEEWGPSGEHEACKRLWFRTDIPLLLDHKHMTDDCWKLRPIGVAVRAEIVRLKEQAA